MRFFALLLLLPLAVGCDVAVVAAAAAGGGGSSSSSAAAAPSAPTVTVAATDAAAAEAGLDPGVFTFTRTGDTTSSLDVAFSVTGTAAGSDYTIGASPVTIPAGLATVTLTVTPVDDSLVEGAETIIVTISASANYFVGTPSTDTVSLTSEDDDDYHVWAKQVAGGTEVAERTALINANGNPATVGGWTDIGQGTATAEFALPLTPFNAILIQASDAQVYRPESVELMNASGVVVEVASGSTFSSLVTTPNAVTGTPDGLPGTTAATVSARAFVFSIYALPGSPTMVRVNIWGAARGPGDVEWVSTYNPGADTSDQRAGGAAETSGGEILIAINSGVFVGRTVELLRLISTGAPSSSTPLEVGITANVGSQSVAVDGSGDVYIAWTSAAGDIQVRRYNAAVTAIQWSDTFASAGPGPARIEAHGLVLDGLPAASNGNVIVAGGIDFGGANGVGHFMQRLRKTNGANWLGIPVAPVDAADSYWYGVALRGNDDIYATGDLTVGTVDARTAHCLESTSGVVDWSTTQDGASALADGGNAVAIDTRVGEDTVLAGGFVTTASGRDGAIFKHTSAGTVVGAPFPLVYTGPGNANDEVLDLAIDTDGSIFAVGYETVTGQGGNFWVRKYSAAGAPLWTRTHRGSIAAGNDRAVSVLLTTTHAIVVGEIENITTNRDIHVRKYVK